MCANKRKRPASAPRQRHKFTKEECRRGYAAALAKCSQDWKLYAWFHYKVRAFFRHKESLP